MLPKATVSNWWRASGGNRTHNPRITNAVLCQLKLRWRGHPAGKRRTAETLKVAQMVTRRQVVRFFKGFCGRTPSENLGNHKYLGTTKIPEALNKKVGSRLGRSVLPKPSGSGARRPLDQKSRRPHFLRCGDGTRKNSVRGISDAFAVPKHCVLTYCFCELGLPFWIRSVPGKACSRSGFKTVYLRNVCPYWGKLLRKV